MALFGIKFTIDYRQKKWGNARYYRRILLDITDMFWGKIDFGGEGGGEGVRCVLLYITVTFLGKIHLVVRVQSRF